MIILQVALNRTFGDFPFPWDRLPFNVSNLPEKIGILAFANSSNSYFTINNGHYEKQKFLKIEKFRGKSELPDYFWPDAAQTPSAQDAGLKGICK